MNHKSAQSDQEYYFPNTGLECLLIKYPLESPVNVSLKSSEDEVLGDNNLILAELKKHNYRMYSYLHNHINNSGSPCLFEAYPSTDDGLSFLLSSHAKSLLIFLQEAGSRNTDGFFIWKKSQKTPKLPLFKLILYCLSDLFDLREFNGPSEFLLNRLEEISEKFSLNYRFVSSSIDTKPYNSGRKNYIKKAFGSKQS